MSFNYANPMSTGNITSAAAYGRPFGLDMMETAAARRDLEQMLVKAGEAMVGYQPEPGNDPDASLSPLLAQSVDDYLANNTTYGDPDFKLFQMLPKENAKQSMHQWRSHLTRGTRFGDASVGEGSAGYNDKSSYGQGIVDIRYWCQKRTLTYQALQLPNGAWLVNGGALKLETQDAVIQIKRQVEMDCMHSDANLSGIKINGIITQLAALTDPIDLAGEQLSFDLLEEQIADLSNVDIGGHPTHILVTPAVFRDLGIQAQNTKGPRYESEGQITGRNFTAGATQMSVFAAGSPDKKIPIISIPYLDEERAYGAPFIPGQGTTLVLAVDPDAKAPATPVVSSGPTPSSSSTSKFTAGEAGSYSYYAIAVNQFGHSAPVAIGTAAVALGEIVTTLFNVPGSNLPDYYLIFRTAKDGAAKTARFLFKVAYVTAGSPAKVVVIDTGAKHRSQSSALILNLSKEEIAFYNLLPLARIPLAMTTLAQPFAVFFSGAPVVKVPLKQRLLTNVAVAASN